MHFHWMPPSADLGHLVKYHWSLEFPASAAGNCLKIVSDAYPELLFHTGHAPRRSFFGAEGSFQSEECLTGIFLRHVKMELRGAVRMFFVKLQPWAIAPVIGLKGGDALDRQAHFSDLPSCRMPPIREMMEEGRKMEEMVGEMENWIRRRMGEWRVDAALEGAVERLQGSQGRQSVVELAGMFMVGRRRLEQLFKEGIGVSPKNFARIVRMRHVCQEMLLRTPQRLTQLAFDCGFFDQSHFIREFKRFTDQTPRQYMAALKGKSSLYDTGS